MMNVIIGNKKKPMFVEHESTIPESQLLDNLLCNRNIRWVKDYFDRHYYMMISYRWKYKYGDYLVDTHPINKYADITNDLRSCILNMLVELKKIKKIDRTLRWPNHWLFRHMRDGHDCVSVSDIDEDIMFKSPIVIMCIGESREIVFKKDKKIVRYKLKSGYVYTLLHPIQKKYTIEFTKSDTGRLSIIVLGKYLQYGY